MSPKFKVKKEGRTTSHQTKHSKWGQNFLSDPKILKKISDFSGFGKEDTILEIGPGQGGLTEFLLQKGGRVIAVEKDKFISEKLRNRFSDHILNNKLKLIEKDILDFEPKNYNLNGGDYVLVGNIPYYITGALFKKFLASDRQPRSITFVTQKEVAERIMAWDKKESILSISIKAYGEPQYGGKIKAGSFYPKPKVDSAIISIRNINKKKFLTSKSLEKKFFEVLRAGFAHKRKFLIKNLSNFFDSDILEKIFEKTKISKKIRAENLSFEYWLAISKLLSSFSKK